MHKIINITAIVDDVQVQTRMRIWQDHEGHYHLPVDFMPFDPLKATELMVDGKQVARGPLGCYEGMTLPTFYEVRTV